MEATDDGNMDADEGNLDVYEGNSDPDEGNSQQNSQSFKETNGHENSQVKEKGKVARKY